MGVVAVGYLVPSFIAIVRRRSNLQTIIAVNLLLGWTVVGWAMALMWSMADRDRRTYKWSSSGRQPCPSCGHSLRRGARRCRYCGYTLFAKE